LSPPVAFPFASNSNPSTPTTRSPSSASTPRARSTLKNGRVNFRQVAKISERLCAFDVTKIVVTHHPFDVPEGHDDPTRRAGP
jgi:hypothetical protein